MLFDSFMNVIRILQNAIERSSPRKINNWSIDIRCEYLILHVILFKSADLLSKNNIFFKLKSVNSSSLVKFIPKAPRPITEISAFFLEISYLFDDIRKGFLENPE